MADGFSSLADSENGAPNLGTRRGLFFREGRAIVDNFLGTDATAPCESVVVCAEISVVGQRLASQPERAAESLGGAERAMRENWQNRLRGKRRSPPVAQATSGEPTMAAGAGRSAACSGQRARSMAWPAR
ncbi:MAG: hypothetical protein RLZZ15_3634 [Verrucomicrobiota bacterium]